MLASIPDVLRLLTIPAFAWIAWRDVRTRRVPNRTWLPLAALAVALLGWELLSVFTGDVGDVERQRFLLRVGLSVGFVVPLAYGFWLIGGFGGADAKAFMVIAILFPTYPVIDLAALGMEGQLATLPVVETTIGVFSLTILSNTVVAGIAYPVVLAGRNAFRGYVSPGMFVAKPIDPSQAVEEYGSLLQFADRSLTDDLSLSGLRDYFTWRGLDLDALRMYLAWRGADLSDLRADPDRYRDPESLPADPNPPGDGAIATDGGRPVDGDDDATDDAQPAEGDASAVPAHDDPWGAEAFLADIEHSAYGTDPEDLRAGLDSLVADDVVWISPGIPFLVPLFAGLVLAVTAGDILFAAFQAVGIA